MSEDFLQANNPLVSALAVLMKPKETQPAQVKLSAFQIITGSDLTVADKHFLIQVMETYMPQEKLTGARDNIMDTLAELKTTWLDECKQIDEAVKRVSKARKQADEALKQGLEQGMEQGLEQGIEKSIYRVLERKFGGRAEEIVGRLEPLSIPIPALETLLDAAIDAGTFDTFYQSLIQVENGADQAHP